MISVDYMTYIQTLQIYSDDYMTYIQLYRNKSRLHKNSNLNPGICNPLNKKLYKLIYSTKTKL